MLTTVSVLQVRCLGVFTFRASGPWTHGPAFKRGREFLQYLVSYSRATASRETLVSVFWPTLDSQLATHRLHVAVAGARAALRAQLPHNEGILCSGGAYALDPKIHVDSDAESLLSASRGNDIEAMRAAVSLYKGEYLAGDEAEWMYPLRIRCSNAYATILERLSEFELSRGNFQDALEFALRLIDTDRAHEGATRLVMRSLQAMGRRGPALAAYDALAAYLQHHLALCPSRQTNDLRAQIVSDG